MSTNYLKVPNTLTVVIRDEGPWGCNEPATYRSVRITLTAEQQSQLQFRHNAEVIGSSFVEHVDDKEPQ